jgi:glycosyltransferase involved in cell wall biosynthesis
MKKIALYYPWCYLKSGVERVILETVQRSRHEYTIFTNHLDYNQTFPEFGDIKNLVVLKDLPVQRSFVKVLQGVWTIVTQRIDLSSYDALLVQSEGLGDFITFRNRSKPIFCFCHTPVRPIYDPVYRQEWIDKHPSKRLLLDVFSFFYKQINRLAWSNYRRVFANSSEVKGRILAGRLCDEDRLEILNPGVAVERIIPATTHGKRFLYAGRIKWTKNVELAIKAFQEFRQIAPDGSEWSLTVTGGVDKASQEYFAGLQALAGADPAIEFRLDPTREELEALYAGCFALLYPPLNEDWGIVPIEAMAFGKPVLAVNSGGPRETVVDGVTGFLVDPDPSAFAARMCELAADPARHAAMGQAGAKRALEFSWDAFVRRLDDYLETNC